MNERIKELMMNSWNTYFNEEMNGTRFPIVQKFDAEKFARLIVRECIEVCGSVAAVRAGYNDADGRDTAYSCGDQIKEHFGVEE